MNTPDEDENAPDALTLSREMRSFTREQMVACESCTRANPPTRMNCLYCGATLPATEATAALRRPVLRPLEEWEQGFNVVHLPDEAGAAVVEKLGDALDKSAILLRLEPEPLREMLQARTGLPLARAANEEEAMLIYKRLSAFGLKVEIVPDEVLAFATATPPRVRRLEFDEESLQGWAGVGSEAHRAAWTEIALLVRGHLFEKRVEVEEKRARLGAEKEMVAAREMFEDEGLLDIFINSTNGVAHWRIAADHFDYTALGERKSLLARENFLTLVEALRTRAPAARYDDGYRGVRHLLASAWPLTESTTSGGLRRERPGKFNVEAITHISNETQFTRYARLRFHLMKKSGV
jgi:hypothetical protein